MKTFGFLLAVALLSLTACRPETTAEREVKVILSSSGGKLTQDLAADVVVEMLGSHTYATEVLRRLSREDRKLFARERDLQKCLSATVREGGKIVRIAFRCRDAAVADRVAAAYEECLVHNWVHAANLEFEVISKNGKAANQALLPTSGLRPAAADL